MTDMQFVEQQLEFLLSTCLIEIITILENSQNILLDRKLAKNRGFLGQITDTEFRSTVHRL